MFEITGDDIAALGDADLRALVGRLCEAELRRHNLSAAAVTWGGDQNAKDGGLDVRVSLPAATAIEGFIPRVNTGFQVKKPNMARAAILDEMRPKPDAALRSVIAELAKASGAYIIVSATGSTSDLALANRKAAMTEAVAGCPDAPKILLDFYDRTRVATWVRDHAGLIPWVRSRIGRAIKGWRSYGSWSYRPEGADPIYLVDAAVRVRTGNWNDGDGIPVTDGINKIRNIVRTSGNVVRLVGLSGVGKTRLAEALFEPNVGANALDSTLAIYADVADDLEPQPGLLASDLIASRSRAILVVDNCPPAIHRQLSEIARSSGSTISIITIEYDIREDQPEGTEVFTLDTLSLDLIENLIKKRTSHLSQIDRKTIAESSGGNARVALALAGTVGKNETIAGLNDAELFRRLFQQRNDPDVSLLSIAQACSLVYSFDGETLEGNEAELPFLGLLAGKSPNEVFAALADLRARHLVQARGVWRAVLPHAIANRLAVVALQKIPQRILLSIIVDRAPVRLLRSFSRRLGYLDGSPEARSIVELWLAQGGILADLQNLNELGRAILENVASTAPGAVLSGLEKAFLNADDETLRRSIFVVRLLRLIAYDAKHFSRCVALLVSFARVSFNERSSESAVNVIESLFYVHWSGTHAPLKLRLDAIDRLLKSADTQAQKLGIIALTGTLETDNFSPAHSHEFGMRSRNYGYSPPDGNAVGEWFSCVLDFAERFALVDGPVGDSVRRAIGSEFRGLWMNVHRTDQLERIGKALTAKRFWRDGWIAARQTRIFAGKHLPAEDLARLTSLEGLLRPKDLVDKVRGVVLADKSGRSIDLHDLEDVEDDDYAAAMERASATIEALGRDVALDEEAFAALLPDLVVGDHKLLAFGRGLALGSDDPTRVWQMIQREFGR
jgi:hypothetical protein